MNEIETKLNEVPEIKKAIVIAKKQDAFLIAYIVKESEKYEKKKCILALEKEFPIYMVPYTYIVLEDFPLTLNNKVDRKILSQREIIKKENKDEFRYPQTEFQEHLLGYWKDVLPYKGEISITDNFFSLRGHSLNAVKLMHQINTELKYAISLKTIFDFPTLISLSNYLTSIDHMEEQDILMSTKKEYYVVTPSQYEIWIASQHKHRSITYNMVAAFEIDGQIDTNRIDKVMYQLILEHEILRTTLIYINGSVYQRIDKIESIKFSVSIKESTGIEVLDQIQKFINCEYNLEQDLLIKMQLIKMSETSSVLVFCTHHIIMDGWSLEKFTQDFLRYYENNIGSKTLDDCRIQFKDYSEWFTSGIEIQKDTLFWENYLKGFKIKESFVLDHILDKEKHKGNLFRFELNREETIALKAFLIKHKTMLHSFLIAVLNILIFKISGHADIIIGTVNYGRSRTELNDMIGMFVKTLPPKDYNIKRTRF